MKHITVFSKDGSILCHAHGDTLLDADEGTLIVHGSPTGLVYTFNWDHVMAFTETPLTEEEIASAEAR